MAQILIMLFQACLKKFNSTGDQNATEDSAEIKEAETLNEILKEGYVEEITRWADKNKDKLDKCMVVQTGKWFSKGQTGTRPDGSTKVFDGPHVMVQAVLFGRVEIVRILQQKGGRLDYRREKGDTALIEAVHFGNLELAKFILASPEIENKKDYVNIVGEGGMTAVFHACTEHNKDAKCLEWLIEQGANIEHRANDVGFSALHYAAVNNTSGAQIQVLLAAGLPLDTSLHNPGGHTALHSAAESKCLKTAATLISAGISPYTKNSLGETPVSIALAKYPQKYANIQTFGPQFKELADSMTSNSNPMR